MTLSNFAKPMFIASILVFSIVGLGFILQDVSANHGEDPGITTPVVVGPNILSFRTLSIENQTSSLTVDYSNSKKGFVTINLEELDANLDSTAIDLVNATANSTTSGPVKANVTLTETGIDTGIFSGTLFLITTNSIDDKLQVSEGDSISVNHEEESQGVGRFQADLEIVDPGNVKITDVLINFDNFIPNNPFEPVTHSVKLEFLDGATHDGPITAEITLSYANSIIPGVSESDINMYYKPTIDLGAGGPFELGWQTVRDGALDSDGDGFDNIAKTISSDLDESKYGALNAVPNTILGEHCFAPGTCFPVLEAEFMLGVPTGSLGGGGGGGLVRPGFVVNALAGANVISSFFGKGGASGEFTGGSSNGPARPTLTSGAVQNVSDENIGFVQQGITSDSIPTSKSLDSTQNVGIGQDLKFSYNVYEDKGADNIIHSTMYFFDAETMSSKARIDVSKSETYIMFNKGQPVKVVDPNGYFEKTGFEISKIDTWNSELKYEITFAKTMPESHIVVRNWDGQKYSADSMFPNAIVVSENSIIDNDDQPTEKEPLTQSEFETSPFLDTQFESELVEEQTITKTGFPGIPLWVKNNAMWWHEKQIDDADFVAGIQYMINEEIITIPETEITNSAPEEIPQWISTIAGYWSNDEIPDEEFVQVVQWLVSNGVMKVV